MEKLERIVGLVFAIVALGLFIYAGNISKFGMDKGVGAEVWPRFLLVLIMLLSLGMLVGTFLKKKGPDENNKELGVWIKEQKKIGLGILILVVYLFVLETVGFLVATILMLIVFMILLGLKKKSTLIIVPTILTLAITYTFYKMGVPLPLGSGVFRQIFLTLFG